MNLSEIVYPTTRFLMLGKCDKELALFKQKGCEGIAVNAIVGELSDDDYYGKILFMEGALHHEGHFQRLMNGKWVKPLTVKDIFDQWGGVRYDLIIIDVPMLTRYLWYSEQIQVHVPKLHVIAEDGHNEQVKKDAANLGYSCANTEDGKWLVMYR